MFTLRLTLTMLLLILSGTMGGIAVLEWKKKEEKNGKLMVRNAVIALMMLACFLYLGLTM